MTGVDPRRAALFVSLVALTFLLPAPLYVMTGYDGGGGASAPFWVVLPVTGAIALLHLRHARAVVLGRNPRFWPVSLATLLLLVYVPFPAWTYNWGSIQTFAVASLLLLLRGTRWAWLAAAPCLFMAAYAWDDGALFGLDSSVSIGFYWLSGLVLGGGCLYASVRLVAVLDELSAAQAALAEDAVDEERLRLARDLHDLLGQSLSAVSLKGDLALALLERDPEAARREVVGLTEVARTALRDVRAVTRDEHRVDLQTEVDGAVQLLAAAGVTCAVSVTAPPPGSTVEQLMAWGVREGVTNVLRHSAARSCTIAVEHEAAGWRLRIDNDGARGREGRGSGLAGLRARAGALHGAVESGRRGDRFRLQLEVPA